MCPWNIIIQRRLLENSLDVTKDTNEEPCDVTKGLQTDNTCARDVQTIDDTQSNIRSKSSTTMDGGVAECDGSKSNPHSSFIENFEKGNSRTCTGNLETVQKLSSETQLDIVPRKRPLKPNSLMNPDEGYDHSWIHKESGTEKSSRSKKARDNSHPVTPSDDPTSIKDKKQSSSKTVSKALVCKVNNGKIETPAQSIKTRDKGSDFPSTKVRKGSEVKHEAPVRNFKLSIKIDGKVLVPPKSIVSPMKPEVLCEDVSRVPM
ncbi:uncharacterized protein [Medicago truncatula]|uniref:uncharacterized protein n=1 Tax=Medicago truncatula TaxID=3880 RepID=UPI0019671A9E|nr:uncharacterized protein LOC120580227 [Medicago truncatula]XP_039689695.1 uncharacterized protein LOC120580227 [Medicago truncatula]